MKNPPTEQMPACVIAWRLATRMDMLLRHAMADVQRFVDAPPAGTHPTDVELRQYILKNMEAVLHDYQQEEQKNAHSTTHSACQRITK